VGHWPLPAGTVFRDDLVVGRAELGASPPQPGMQRHAGRGARAAALAKPAAVGVAAVSVVLCAGAVTLLWLAPAHHPYGYDISGDVAVGCLFPLAGALVAVHEPGNRCAWVMLSTGLVAVSAFSHEWAYDGLARPGLLPLVPVATWLAAWTWAPYWLQATLLPVMFPDGTVPSRRWRLFVTGVLTLVAVLTVVAMFRPDPDVEGLGVRNPLGIGPAHVGQPWQVLLRGPVVALAFGAAPAALVALVARQRRATGRVRAQLQWLLLGFVACLLIVAVAVVAPSLHILGGHYGLAVGFAMIPLAVAVAAVRHGLFDIELVVNRAIVYVALTALGLAAYVGLLAATGAGAGRGTYAPLLAVVIAAALTAARSRFQRFVDRKLFGARRDPYEVVRRVGVSVAAADTPGQGLANLVGTVCEVLALPYAAVEWGGPGGGAVIRAESGRPVPWVEDLPAVHRGRQVGVLRVAHRHRGERFRPEEASALGDVARRAASLLHAAGLSADLQASRERIVVAREEERRRLRRDLHDGLGPELAGMALQLDSLASSLGGQDGLAERAIRLRDRLQHTVTEVRRVVEGLRPGAVDELGLAEALRQLAAAGADLEFAVHVPATFGDLPAAVEVAAYRIAAEACTNVIRHARASRCCIEAGIQDGWLTLMVIDNGTGFGAEAAVGVGLQSMHDRAAEVGGSLEVRSASGGTTVSSRLPLEAV
jgi:signal transduction histidine kinase